MNAQRTVSGGGWEQTGRGGRQDSLGGRAWASAAAQKAQRARHVRVQPPSSHVSSTVITALYCQYHHSAYVGWLAGTHYPPAPSPAEDPAGTPLACCWHSCPPSRCFERRQKKRQQADVAAWLGRPALRGRRTDLWSVVTLPGHPARRCCLQQQPAQHRRVEGVQLDRAVRSGVLLET